MRVTVKVGGPLRRVVKDLSGGERELELPAGATVSQALAALGLDWEAVRTIMLNGRPVKRDRALAAGDRLALFPPECCPLGEIVVMYAHRPPGA
jgi:sulfur carrier protein ThiS